ncbi:predicted protein [Aspergillus nidulans FGSC A4]|uniref:Uncharacterized protein n=1 Tax=Emericella nidulans (strain FGSC A4 / ATCC 38163 / CBS 112.46 / NRRL 194 / M139) TaxID=227321 RepID=Q5AZY6_EMENI|nr:hypothetical protein [Aspergillus nidulans FGSC A4]EAA57930.1 predicted protein [Aspergillus nidulans FGSC A4]CBF70094.1 TPA: conserved hypothetical protein [Aspergillus nidulans FGSC A4]|eukprot:XP_663748.1 predicted protein [Aspergillus nidulans FGSC A4]
MCLFWITKYLCSCLYDEFYYPCSWASRNPETNPDPALRRASYPQNCHVRSVEEIIDCSVLCELCFEKLHDWVRKDCDIKKTLARNGTSPLVEQLGMLILLENEKLEQWKIFGKDSYRYMTVGIEELEKAERGVEMGIGVRRARKGNGRDAWKRATHYTQEETEKRELAASATGMGLDLNFWGLLE